MVELTDPLDVFRKAGIPAEIASIRGGHPSIDFFDLSDPVNNRFSMDHEFGEALGHPLILGEVDSSRYSAVFFAGGHGTMWNFAGNAAVQRVIREIYEGGGVVSAVCHGPAALVNATLSNGTLLGQPITELPQKYGDTCPECPADDR